MDGYGDHAILHILSEGARRVRAAQTAPRKGAAPEPVSADRFESFEAVRPDGVVVVVTRNIDTGEQTVTEKAKHKAE